MPDVNYLWTKKMKRILLILIILMIFLVSGNVSGAQIITSDGAKIFYDLYGESFLNSTSLIIISDSFRSSYESSSNFASRLGENYLTINVQTRGKYPSTDVHRINSYECRDLYEVSKKIQLRYPDITNFYLSGTSGAAGRALACANLYPDYYSAVISFYGIANYTLWDEESNEEVYKTGWINGKNYENPEAYESRGAMTSAQNLLIPLMLIHDPADTSVSVRQSRKYNETLNNLGKSVTLIEDSVGHIPHPHEAYVQEMYKFFRNFTNNYFIKSIGSFTIQSHLVSKNFSFDLRNDSVIGYLDYDISNSSNQTFDLSSLSLNSSNVEVRIFNLDKGKTYSLYNLNHKYLLLTNISNLAELTFYQTISPDLTTINLMEGELEGDYSLISGKNNDPGGINYNTDPEPWAVVGDSSDPKNMKKSSENESRTGVAITDNTEEKDWFKRFIDWILG